MRGYYLATNVLALTATGALWFFVIFSTMTWWLALLGSIAINLVAVAYTMDEDTDTL